MRTMPHQIDKPVAGVYKTKLVRGGVWVPVRFEFGPPPDPENPAQRLDRSHRWLAWIADDPADPYELWPWCCGRPIDEAEYRYLMALSRHAKAHAPELPEADPTKPIDFHKSPVLF